MNSRSEADDVGVEHGEGDCRLLQNSDELALPGLAAFQFGSQVKKGYNRQEREGHQRHDIEVVQELRV